MAKTIYAGAVTAANTNQPVVPGTPYFNTKLLSYAYNLAKAKATVCRSPGEVGLHAYVLDHWRRLSRFHIDRRCPSGESQEDRDQSED